MAGRLAFHYLPGQSFLHAWDVRCKFLGLLTVTLGLLHMGALPLVSFSLLLLAALISTRPPLRALLRDLKGWGIFLLVLFVAQALFHSEPSLPRLVPWLPVGLDGLRLAAVSCWRLLLIIGYATVFTLVTRPRELQNGIIWLLSPFPFLPARRIALMVTLTLRFLPVILDQAEEVQMAIRSRLGNRRKNPLVRAKASALPLLRRSLTRADQIALALAARGYREDLPLILPHFPRGHLVPLVLLMAVVGLSAIGLPAPVQQNVHVLMDIVRDMV